MKNQKHTCSCGAVYELTEHPQPMRDKDEIRCRECGAVVVSWNGGCTWTARRVDQAPEKS